LQLGSSVHDDARVRWARLKSSSQINFGLGLPDCFAREKVHFASSLFSKSIFPPRTQKPGKPHLSTFKTIHFTSLTRLLVFKGGFVFFFFIHFG
jgi:hypothetical protein